MFPHVFRPDLRSMAGHFKVAILRLKQRIRNTQLLLAVSKTATRHSNRSKCNPKNFLPAALKQLKHCNRWTC